MPIQISTRTVLAESDRKGVTHWRLSEDVWTIPDDDYVCKWTGDATTFDMTWFDPRYSSHLANVFDIDGLGPCLRSKLNPSLYILRDRNNNYYYWDEDTSDLRAFTRELEEVMVLTEVYGHDIDPTVLIDVDDFKQQLLDEKNAKEALPATPKISATHPVYDPGSPSKSPKRKTSPVKMAGSPDKKLRTERDESVKTVEPASTKHSDQRSATRLDDVDAKNTTDATLVANVGTSLHRLKERGQGESKEETEADDLR